MDYQQATKFYTDNNRHNRLDPALELKVCNGFNAIT